MDSYTSMKSKLAPTGLYGLEPGSEVDCELTAYAAGLQPLFQQLDEIEREAFIVTAQTYGLSERELFTGSEKSDLPVETRRSYLLTSEHSLGGEASLEGFKAYLSKCGISQFTVRENVSHRAVQIFIDDNLTDGEKSLVRKKITGTFPVHLNVTVHYRDGGTESY